MVAYALVRQGELRVDDLPANAQAYVQRLDELFGARISTIGVGQAGTRPSS